MEIYFLRHGEAEPARSKMPTADFERPLTDEGRKNIELEALGLRKVLPNLDVVLCSPLVRALQTAEIFAEIFEVEGGPIECDALVPPCSVNRLLGNISSYSDTQRILCVGHTPSLGIMATQMVTGLEGEHFFPLKTGGLLRMDLEELDSNQDAKLLSFLPPQFLIKLGMTDLEEAREDE